MKLLDILAKELDEWPTIHGEGAMCIVQDGNGRIKALDCQTIRFDVFAKMWIGCGPIDCHGIDVNCKTEPTVDHDTSIITKEMWESARNNAAQDRTAIPPIDAECKFTYKSGPKQDCTVKDIGHKGVYLYIPSRDSNAYDYDCYKWYPKDQLEFFVESDRDKAINSMVMAACSGLTFNNEVKAYLKHMAEVLYDAGWRKTKSNED